MQNRKSDIERSFIQVKYYKDVIKEDRNFHSLMNAKKIESINGLQIVAIDFLEPMAQRFDVISNNPYEGLNYSQSGINSHGCTTYDIVDIQERDKKYFTTTCSILKSGNSTKRINLISGASVIKAGINDEYIVVKYFLASTQTFRNGEEGEIREEIEGINTFLILNKFGKIVKKWENTTINFDYPVVENSYNFMACSSFTDETEAILFYDINNLELVHEFTSTNRFSIPIVVGNKFIFWESTSRTPINYRCYVFDISNMDYFYFDFNKQERSSVVDMNSEEIILKNDNILRRISIINEFKSEKIKK